MVTFVVSNKKNFLKCQDVNDFYRYCLNKHICNYDCIYKIIYLFQNTVICISCSDLLERVDELYEQIRVGRRELKVLKRKLHHFIYYKCELGNYSSSESEDDLNYDSFLVSTKIWLYNF